MQKGKRCSWDTFKQQPVPGDVYAYSIVVTAKNKQGLLIVSQQEL